MYYTDFKWNYNQTLIRVSYNNRGIAIKISISVCFINSSHLGFFFLLESQIITLESKIYFDQMPKKYFFKNQPLSVYTFEIKLKENILTYPFV